MLLLIELMKSIVPQKIPVCFSRCKKIPASFIDPKKYLWAKISDPTPSPPEWGPWDYCLVGIFLPHDILGALQGFWVTGDMV